jgi:ketosteroid isomerase-like protein
LLRPGFLPIIEGDVIKFLNAQEDTSFTMTWEPKGGDIASSGDMGFTYGVYKVATADTTLKGTYLNVWRKQADGKWKFVIDTGNPGIEKEGIE